MRAASRVGLPMTATIMYGHVEHPRHRIMHLERIRQLQDETGNITEFVPLKFVYPDTPLHDRGLVEGSSGACEDRLMMAVSRLFLDNIDNLQSSWVKYGDALGLQMLNGGANDFMGTLLSEEITRRAGGEHGQFRSFADYVRMIESIDRRPVERSTDYSRTRPVELSAADHPPRGFPESRAVNSLEYTVLGGGTGTPMLLDGFATLKEVDPRSITVVVNTADDVLVSGARVCPDLDSVLYTLADLVDRDRWYGIQGDTATTHRRLNDLAPPGEEPPDPPSPGKLPSYPADSEFMNIGDRDRATHLFRSARLQRGDTLTETTRRLARRLGVASRVLPMSEDPVSSLVHTEQEGVMHLQEYLVRHASNPTPTRIHPVGLDDAKPTGPVLEALEQPVVIGPSNPVTSVEPILNLPGVRAARPHG